MNEKEIKKMVSDSIPKMNVEFIAKWVDLSLYLENEKMEGKKEFRLVIGDKGKCYIHPLGKDGKTLDFEL